MDGDRRFPSTLLGVFYTTCWWKLQHWWTVMGNTPNLLLESEGSWTHFFVKILLTNHRSNLHRNTMGPKTSESCFNTDSLLILSASMSNSDVSTQLAFQPETANAKLVHMVNATLDLIDVEDFGDFDAGHSACPGGSRWSFPSVNCSSWFATRRKLGFYVRSGLFKR